MFWRARALLTIVACALATPVAAQAPAPTTAFDGKYVGTATIIRDQGVCIAIPRVDMTIAGGQVIIHEFFFNGFVQIYRGSVNATGEVSTQFQWRGNGSLTDTLNGTIRDKVFTGLNIHGSYCHWHVQMGPDPSPTMPFDGDYVGVSRESSCLPNVVPATLVIKNSIVTGGSWRGNVNPQGVVVMGNRFAPRVDGQIDSHGIIRAQGSSSDGGCTVTFVWRKQSG